MANDTNNLYCQIIRTTSLFLGTKEIYYMGKKRKSSTTNKTTKETIYRTTTSIYTVLITVLEQVSADRSKTFIDC